MHLFRAQSLERGSIAHGFFGRTGGVSTGIFASLNCGPGSGDDLDAVAENRRRALRELSPAPNAQLLTMYQIHGAEAVVVTAPWEMDARPKADAMVTNVPGLALGILTADCAPVLLADAEAGVIGAAHAGWKGALAGVIESAIRAMETLSADRARIAAAIGPSITQANYEVSDEFRRTFTAADAETARFFHPGDRPEHWRFDLPGYVEARLRAAGVASVEPIAACTYAREQDFYSFRRATHRGEKDYGRQLSAILLTP
jgi:YfiH family protein